MTLHLTSIDAPRAPDGLAEFEGVVTASGDPAALMMINRSFMRELLAYVRRLESEVRRDGGFW
jgi:hypothetical protein